MAIVNYSSVQDIAARAKFNASYAVLMAASGVLAAIALLTSSTPMLVGAMIVAPAYEPLALVAFAIVGGRSGLAVRGLIVSAAGLIIAVAFAVLTTWVMNVTNVLPADMNLLDKPLLKERVSPGWWSVAAASAAGIAGTVALAQGKTDTLVGTVAALALVPAGASAGMALLSDDPEQAFGGLTLLGINVGLIILSGIATLLILRPDQED